MENERIAPLLQEIFPDGGKPPDFEDAATLDLVAQAENKIALLSPANGTQRWLQPHILAIFNNVTQQHFELVKERHGSRPPALVLLLFAWLALLFAARGLLVPRHKMSLLVHLLTPAAAAAGAILLIMDLETPAKGFVRLSAEPPATCHRDDGQRRAFPVSRTGGNTRLAATHHRERVHA